MKEQVIFLTEGEVKYGELGDADGVGDWTIFFSSLVSSPQDYYACIVIAHYCQGNNFFRSIFC